MIDRLDIIRNCGNCYGTGVIGWTSPDGDYDFEWCECNPDELVLDPIDGSVLA